MQPATSYHLLAIDLIEIPSGRQRQDINQAEIDTLATSIAAIDLINPIVVRPNLTREGYALVAGERRLRAVQKLGWKIVPCHFMKELQPLEASVVELEENIRRVDLTWQERVNAITDYHTICVGHDASWTAHNTAQALRIQDSTISKALLIKNEAKTNPDILKSDTLTSAHNKVVRKQDRAIAVELQRIDEHVTIKGLTPKEEAAGHEAVVAGDTVHDKDPGYTGVTCASFLDWAPTYEGAKFNFLHCDFPYGVGIHESDQMQTKSGAATSYEDTEEVYWHLVKCLADNVDRLLFDSAHMLFWFSMNYYSETQVALEVAGFDVNPFPLIWHKSDAKGILPDAQRGPRRTYETAFLCSRGDRKIVRAVANSYACPTGRDHQSEKPEPMLKHFLTMFVDVNTEMLDPTCGSGTALRAAETLGAQTVMGLDINEESVKFASSELARVRNLKNLETQL